MSAAKHKPTLASLKLASLNTLLLMFGITHCTCTQGCGAPAILKGQPAMVNTSDGRTTKSPPAFTLALALVAITCPPWGHISMEEVVSKFGMADFGIGYLQFGSW